MEEVYTCACGHQHWTIFGRIIECTSCKKRYYMFPQDPRTFNITKQLEVLPATG